MFRLVNESCVCKGFSASGSYVSEEMVNFLHHPDASRGQDPCFPVVGDARGVQNADYKGLCKS
jgi:hypothetical protein